MLGRLPRRLTLEAPPEEAGTSWAYLWRIEDSRQDLRLARVIVKDLVE